MLYVLTQTPGLSSLGWSPTGFHTTWTTHRQNGDNLIYSSCSLGTYRGRFFASFALIKGNGVIPGVRSFPGYTEEILVCVPDSHELQTHTHTHTHIHTHTHTHTHTQTNTHTNKQTHKQTNKHTHTHTHTHTHGFR